MSGNFVRERQRIVYIYNIHVYYICKQYVAARARNFQTFLGRLCSKLIKTFNSFIPDMICSRVVHVWMLSTVGITETARNLNFSKWRKFRNNSLLYFFSTLIARPSSNVSKV